MRQSKRCATPGVGTYKDVEKAYDRKASLPTS